MLDMADGFARLNHLAKGRLDLTTEVRDCERTLNVPQGSFKALFEYLFRGEILRYRSTGLAIRPVSVLCCALTRFILSRQAMLGQRGGRQEHRILQMECC
jgi:hypothetical protein